jgi:ApaG protein
VNGLPVDPASRSSHVLRPSALEFHGRVADHIGVTKTAAVNTGSDCLTGGFRVQVWPHYLPGQSDPDQRRWVFGYRIRITNTGPSGARLMRRRWLIVDAHGRESEVAGDGVVGRQPDIAAGAGFEYTSFCPLNTPWGTMEGVYAMRRDDGSEFEIAIKRFYLVGPSAPARA